MTSPALGPYRVIMKPKACWRCIRYLNSPSDSACCHVSREQSLVLLRHGHPIEYIILLYSSIPPNESAPSRTSFVSSAMNPPLRMALMASKALSLDSCNREYMEFLSILENPSSKIISRLRKTASSMLAPAFLAARTRQAALTISPYVLKGTSQTQQQRACHFKASTVYTFSACLFNVRSNNTACFAQWRVLQGTHQHDDELFATVRTS
mmetsp:Transcript_76143/g.204374  ORF Transcript_76143/g.204374 Transcript_76143/m.204374 type:complete len:209 (-) Transcript_76143:98-724(-)